jgi:hypothetical protein
LRFGISGPQRDGRLILRNGLLVAAKRRKRSAEIVVRFRVIRIDRQRVAIMRRRLFGASGGLQRVAEIVVRLGKVWLERDRFLAAADRFVMPLQSGQRDRQMKLRVGRAWGDLHGAPEQNFRVGETGLLQSQQAESIERVEVPAIGVENDPIALFRFLQPSAIVQQGCFGEYLRVALRTAPLLRSGTFAR